MLRNYFLLAIAMLKKKKFFTVISLFGICLTMTVLIVLASFIDYLVSPNYPDLKRDRSLYIFNLQEKNSKTGEIEKDPPSYYFLDHFVRSLRIPEKIGISSGPKPLTIYVNSKKTSIYVKYTNAEYFDVMSYDFLEGSNFTRQQVDHAEKVAVITEQTRDFFFGTTAASVVGKYIEIAGSAYRVQGVVRNVSPSMPFCYSDIILPVTVAGVMPEDRSYFGEYQAVLLAQSKDDLAGIKAEYDRLVSKIPPEGKKYDQVFSHADSYFEAIIRPIFGERSDFRRSGFSTVFIASAILVLLFMSLPAINLMNINLTRIMERSSEIGVRKSFGATSFTLVIQFLVENIIVTLLGSIIAVALSCLILWVINSSDFIRYLHLQVNYRVLLFCIVASLFFGFISGVYPAWRMSRLPIADALKTT